MSPFVAAVLLVVALLPLWPAVARRLRPAGRRYPAMVIASWLRFGVPAIVLLGVTGQWGAFTRLPDALLPAAVWLGVDGFGTGDRWRICVAGAVGVGIGVGGGVLLTAWRAWRGRPEGTLFGDAGLVRPRGRDELGWAAALAATAGVTEEAYFRLLLPLLATAAFGNAVAAFAGATLLFGLAHWYQGWRGVAATTVAGAAMAAAYLAMGSLPAVMAFHVAGDLSHLVLRPALRGWILRRRSETS